MDGYTHRFAHFGKLPNFGDFIRYNAGGVEIRFFEHWIEEGLYFFQKQYNQDWEAIYEASPPYRFVFSPEDSGRVLIGTLRASRDKSGRHYPFVISFKLEKNDQDRDFIPLLPEIYSRFFDRAFQLLDMCLYESAVQNVAALTRGLESTLPSQISVYLEEFEKYLSVTNLGTFWNTVLGRADDPRRFLVFKNISDILLPLRVIQPERLSLGLRFPLGSETARIGTTICVWIRICMQLLGRPGLFLTYFWGRGSQREDYFLYLFFKNPSFKNFSQLIRPESQMDSMCKLEEEGIDKIATAAQNLGPEIETALMNNETVLLEFMEKLRFL
jgi:type VI secretion system protein ImpM